MADRIDPARWYSAREAAALLEVTEATVKSYCREEKIQGKRRGPKRQWFTQGKEIARLRNEWSLDS